MPVTQRFRDPGTGGAEKPEALKVGEYYRIGNVHENLIQIGDCQACRGAGAA